MEQLYICHTVYHVYVACVKQILGNEKSDIVLTDYIPQAKALWIRLQQENLFEHVYLIEHNLSFAKWTRSSFHLNYLYCTFCGKKTDNYLNFILKYKNIYIFNDYSDLGGYLIKRKKSYHLLEDGCNVFQQFDTNRYIGKNILAKKILFSLLKIPYTIGISKYCIDIEINDSCMLKTNLKKKLICVSRKQLFSKLKKEQLSIIFRIFDFCEKDINNSGKKIILLTQVLTEIGVVKSDAEQLRYYENELLKYKDEYEIYIKPHPRDRVNYEMISSGLNVHILNKTFPVELFNFIPNFSIDIALTYSSTSAQAITFANQIIVLDKTINLEAEVEK